eukprot:TRINITY_DN2897_c0_g1_i3.p1 TRINITY_DN2897_c0_g1~~TRINITY_DN2897_c0_g1_i3.p1  ORF type:complete len:146 (-),score=50.28 TRINITY_DN2897_c0_g1_i3:161-598(-)
MEETFSHYEDFSSAASSRSGSISPSGSHASDSYQARKPYRLASSFELGDEQPQVYRQRAQKIKATSYQNLFGAPADVTRACVRRVARAEREQPVRRNKPLPVNTLTGAIIGVPDQKIPQALSRSLPVQTQFRARRSPGGNHSQLW